MSALTKETPFDYDCEYLALDAPNVGRAMGTVYAIDADRALDAVEALYENAKVTLKVVKVTAKVHAVGGGLSISRYIQPKPFIPGVSRPPYVPPAKVEPVDVLAKVHGLKMHETYAYPGEVLPYLVHTKENDDAEADVEGSETETEGGDDE